MTRKVSCHISTMHRISICFAVILLGCLNIGLCSASSASKHQEKSCPETYRELRRRNDEDATRFPSRFNSNDDDDDDDDDDGNDEDDMTDDQWRESVCEQTMKYIVQRGTRGKIDPVLLNTFCPHYQESSFLSNENNDKLCEQKKEELEDKRKRDENDEKKRFYADFLDNDDGHDDNRRRALRKKELKKKFAVRFIRKRMLFNRKRSH